MTDGDHPSLVLTYRYPSEFVEPFRAGVADRLGYDPLVVPETPAETREAIASAEALVSTRLPDEWLDAAESLAWLQTISAGVDHLDHDRLRERDVALTNASGVHAEPIAEQVLGYLLAFERRLHTAMDNQRRGVWEVHRGGEVRGGTMCVVGLGAIGSRVAELASALGVRVAGTKRDPSKAPEAADEVRPPEDLHELLVDSTYLVLACPLTERTRGLIGREELELLGEDGVLVNVARGEIVDEAALTRMLQGRYIRGAALDVFESEPLSAGSPLWDLSNVIVTPHIAGSSPRKPDRLADVVAANYERFVAGEFDAMENRIV